MCIRVGDKSAALRVINRALDNDKLSDSGRAYLKKRRAFVYMMFGDYERAQSDIHEVSKIQIVDSEVLAIQARIWAAQDREIENAYSYAMALVKRDAALLVKDADAPEKMMQTALELLSDHARRTVLEKNALAMALPDAARKIVEEIYKLI